MSDSRIWRRSQGILGSSSRLVDIGRTLGAGSHTEGISLSPCDAAWGSDCLTPFFRLRHVSHAFDRPGTPTIVSRKTITTNAASAKCACFWERWWGVG